MTSYGLPVTAFVLVLLLIFIVVALVRSVRIVPQSQAYVIERLGRFQAVFYGGFHVLVPFVDRVASRIDLREQVAPVAVRLADPGLHVRGLSVEESHWLASRLAQSGQDHALWRERWHHLRRRGGTARAARRRRPRGE